MRSAALIVAGVFLTFPVWGQTVTDGDTIKLGGTIYRLWGIDAPESHQVCNGWPAGTEATAELRRLIAGRAVACEPKTVDRYGRTVAICRVDGADLGAAMVAAGMAWAFVRYSSFYLPQEREARAAGVGVHAHDCLAPWDWRANRRQ